MFIYFPLNRLKRENTFTCSEGMTLSGFGNFQTKYGQLQWLHTYRLKLSMWD